jgi:hypothetical protein
MTNAAWVAQEMVERGRHRGTSRCVLAAVGLPNSGKSTLINRLGSVIAQQPITLVQEGGLAGVAEGHLTLRQRRQELIADSCRLAGVDAPKGFELALCDLVGVRGIPELRCALLGQTRQGALWPTDERVADAAGNRVPLPPDEVQRRIAEIQARGVSCLDVAHGALLVITANTLMTLQGLGAQLTAATQELLSDFSAHIPGEHGHPTFPVRLVVTQVDLWAAGEGVTDPRCMLGGAQGVLGPLYAAAKASLGYDASQVTAIGFLNDDGIDYADGSDPRVVVLKTLLNGMSGACCTFLAQLMRQLAPEGTRADGSG